MNPQYSILYASIRKVTQEKLSLGLLVFGEETIYFKFSPKKLNALKSFLAKDEYKLIHQSVNAVKTAVLSHSQTVTVGGRTLFKVSHEGFSVDYISYLSRYKNNLITYSEPKPIDMQATEENVLKLYDSLIGIDQETVYQSVYQSKLTPIEQLNLQFNGEIENHFNINYTLTTKHVPNLLVPVKVDLVGRNEMDVLVRTIDMSAQPDRISNEVATFFLLTEAYRDNKIPFKNFILATEPLNKHRKQHDIWQQISESKNFNYLDLSEASKLKEYAETHNVKPMMPIEDSDLDSMPF
jgi:hypothetical protein